MSKAFTREGNDAPDEDLEGEEANPIPAGEIGRASCRERV